MLKFHHGFKLNSYQVAGVGFSRFGFDRRFLLPKVPFALNQCPEFAFSFFRPGLPPAELVIAPKETHS